MLFNKTTRKKVCGKARLANHPWQKLKGLMFEDEKNFDYALVFDLGEEHRFSAGIHMMFVFFPIDVVWLDKNKKVVDKVEGIKPFTPNYIPKKRARYFVELPVGNGKKIKIGNELDWKISE